VDRSVTRNLGEKISTGELLPVEQVKDIARDALVEEWSAGVEIAEEDADEGASSRDAAIDMSVDLAGFHHRVAAPSLQPTHVQREWVLDIAGLPIQLAGTIDIQEGAHSIRDTKTSGKSPNKTVADTSLQLTTYALAVKAHDGKIPDAVVLDYLVRTPARKESKLIQLVSKRTDADIPHLLERVSQASRMIEAGIFMPAPVDSWVCSARFCPYFKGCKYAARPVSVAA
jgi:CRISPR/Cas system-associated exonuclease Cas4 (RecB family)